MAYFPNQQLTQGGWDALADALAGQRLRFVRMAVGDGSIASDDDILEMTELANFVRNIPITDYRSLGDGRVTMTGILRSAEVETGFYLREIGVFCTVENGPEILYSLNNSGDRADYMPGRDEGATVVIQAIEVQVLISRAENVEVVVVIGEAGLEGENLGEAGSGVFAGRTANRLQFKRLVGSAPIVVTETEESVGIALGEGEDGDGEGEISLGVPTGTIVAYGSQTSPNGWLRCIGTAVSRTDYARLFGVIGTAFGAGDGSTTFNLPDLAKRFPVGSEVSWGLWAEHGGAETHVLTVAELASHGHNLTLNAHNHGIGDPTHQHTVASSITRADLTVGGTPLSHMVAQTQATTHAAIGAWTDWQTVTGSAIANGSNAAHNNMPPYLGVNYIIKD